MIIGIGNDLINILRIEKTIDRFGNRFLRRVFTQEERIKSDKRRMRTASYAKRFAAKEACSKALGTGFRKGVFWHDLEVGNLPSGQPTMKLTGGALERLIEITPKGHVVQIDLTLTDEMPIAEAFIIISAIPDHKVFSD